MTCIISIATSKGGGGKTALTCCLAVNLLAHGYRVHVVDADANQAFAFWCSKTYEGPPLAYSAEITHERIVDHVLGLGDQFDVVLVDTAGFANQTASFAMGASDGVLIPCMSDRNSALEALRTLERVRSLSKIARRDIFARVVLTRWDPKRLSARAALQDLEAVEAPTLHQHLSDLTVFEQYTFTGSMPRNGRVGHEIDLVIEELQALEVVPPLERINAA